MTDTSSMGEIPDGWIEHDGKGMPVDPDTRVEVRFRSGKVCPIVIMASGWGNGAPGSNWNHYQPVSADIVAYRVVKP